MVNNLRWLVILGGVFFLSACAGLKNGPGSGQAPPVQPAVSLTQDTPDRDLLERPHNTFGGLWTDVGHRGLLNDLRAKQVGDLVTVNIVETSSASKKATTRTGRESSINAGISNLMGYEEKLGKIGGPLFDNETLLKASMTNDFSGSGETSRNETMTASITATVVEVVPNGNLMIRGTREVGVNNENQLITLTGIIRPSDISPDNTILSSYIADARITYSGRGAVSDKQRPGWLLRVVDFVWPF